MKTLPFFITAACLAALTPGTAAAEGKDLLRQSTAAAEGKDLLRQSGIKGGVVVHLGCGDASLTRQLAAGESFLVHGLDTDPSKIATAREQLLAAGRYGAVTVDRWDGRRLPYIDNFVNLIVAEDPAQADHKELHRALAPNGVLLTKQGDAWKKSVKPWPAEMGQWTHRPSACSGSAPRAGPATTTTWPA